MPRNAAASVVLPAGSTLGPLIEELSRDAKLGPQLLYTTHLPGSEARYGDLDLPESISRALGRGGVPRLWTPQTEGIETVRRVENVLVTTPTASGKSLFFQVPPLEEAA